MADERGPQTWRGWPVCGGCGKPRIPEGLGTALKPSTEPIVLARKPLGAETVAGTPDALGKAMRADTKKWADVARQAGLKPE